MPKKVGACQLVRQDGRPGGLFYGTQPLQPTQTRAPTGERVQNFLNWPPVLSSIQVDTDGFPDSRFHSIDRHAVIGSTHEDENRKKPVNFFRFSTAELFQVLFSS
jgi:hypothetical protein